MPRTSAPPNQEILEAALQGLEAQKQKLDEQIQQVRSMLGGRRVGRPSKSAESSSGNSSSAAAANASDGRRKRILSSEARKRIAAAQKKRWAAFRKSQG